MSVAIDLALVQRRIETIGGAAPAAPHSAAAVRSSEFASQAFGRLVSGEIQRLVRAAANEARVDPSLVSAVVQTESGFDPRASSAAGAVGLMQLMPATATSLGVTDPYDPAQNVRGGASYLRALLARFHENVPLAVAAYNAGPGAVERYGGIPPYAETRAYVGRVMATYRGRVPR